ncbi:MAG: hypothetical protein ABFS14_04650 [Gemmatimonadota bacterium]
MNSIAVTLSGGGYRASLFGLGVFLYLSDIQKYAEVTSISSVSGGSVTNAYIAQLGDTNGKNLSLWGTVGHLVRTIAHQTLWSTPRTWAYLGSLLITILAIGYLCFWFLPWTWWIRLLAFLALLLPWGWLLRQRGAVAGRAFGAKLYSPSGRPTLLEDIAHDRDHVICATHLNAGEHFFFSGRFVYSYRFGWGVPGGLPLHTAVQASAAFPGGFPPRWLRTKRFGFPRDPDRRGSVARLVALTDGGVYDNMADQWPDRVEERARQRPDLKLMVPDQLVVVNASRGLAWSPVRSLRIPFFGEFLALLRDVDVMYDNASSLRMQSLVERFKTAGRIEGALITIEQSPFKIPTVFEAHGDAQQRQRATAALDQLGRDNEAEWTRITELNSGVATTLSKLGTEVSVRLLRHGYATAMANLSVILGFPTAPVPERSEFERLANKHHDAVMKPEGLSDQPQ